MTNTKIKFICVMDYRICEVRFYNVEVDAKDFDSFDAESWLNENTSYNSDCCYMVCDKAIKISHVNAKKYFINAKIIDGEYHKCDIFEEQKRHDDVKEFASEVRKTIEDTFKNFGGSTYFSFADHGLDLIAAVQNKLDEVLK